MKTAKGHRKATGRPQEGHRKATGRPKEGHRKATGFSPNTGRRRGKLEAGGILYI